MSPERSLEEMLSEAEEGSRGNVMLSPMFDRLFVIELIAAVRAALSPMQGEQGYLRCEDCGNPISKGPQGWVHEDPDQRGCERAVPMQGELPRRPTKETVKQFATLLTGISYVQWAEFVRYADALESLLRASNAEVGRLREELDLAYKETELSGSRLGTRYAAYCDANPKPLMTFFGWLNNRIKDAEAAESKLATTLAAGQQKGREECLEAVGNCVNQQECWDAILALPKVGQ